jgi:hypothetical protein
VARALTEADAVVPAETDGTLLGSVAAEAAGGTAVGSGSGTFL